MKSSMGAAPNPTSPLSMCREGRKRWRAPLLARGHRITLRHLLMFFARPGSSALIGGLIYSSPVCGISMSAIIYRRRMEGLITRCSSPQTPLSPPAHIQTHTVYTRAIKNRDAGSLRFPTTSPFVPISPRARSPPRSLALALFPSLAHLIGRWAQSSVFHNEIPGGASRSMKSRGGRIME